MLNHNLLSDYDFVFNEKKPEIAKANGAMPHRYPWNDIKKSTERYEDGTETSTDFERWTDRLLKAGEEKLEMVGTTIEEVKDNIMSVEEDINNLPKKLKTEDLKRKRSLEEEKQELEQKQQGLEELEERWGRSQTDFKKSRDDYAQTSSVSNKNKFVKQANSFHANVPDFGPHFKVNNPVSDHAHLHLPLNKTTGKRSPSPMSRQTLAMSPHRLSTVAVDSTKSIITTTGEVVDPSELDPIYQNQINQYGTHVTKSYDPNFKFGF